VATSSPSVFSSSTGSRRASCDSSSKNMAPFAAQRFQHAGGARRDFHFGRYGGQRMPQRQLAARQHQRRAAHRPPTALAGAPTRCPDDFPGAAQVIQPQGVVAQAQRQ
jgi:hypothetical protein